MNNRIDYIFVVDPMRVNTYKVINDKPNGLKFMDLKI